MIKTRLEEDLKKAVQTLGYETVDIVCDIPQNSEFGDYSSNVALQQSKQNSNSDKQSPLDIAKEIKEKLDGLEYLEKIEIAGPGFLNFFIKKEALASDLEEVLSQDEDYGRSDLGEGKKARVEFVSANPTGPLHIGNARGGPLGDSLASVLQFVGYEVLREYIHNDVGNQVKALGETIKAVLSGNISEEHQYKGEYVKELAQRLSSESELGPAELGKKAVDLLFEEIKDDCSKMGIRFDLVVNESDLQKEAPKVLEELKKTGVLKEKDGALWLAPSDEFLEDRETVVVKSDGGFTYFTSDIVYHKKKFESGATKVIDVFGSNHHGHVPRLKAAVKALGFNPSFLDVILYQYVRVKRGEDVVKMSKRAGNFVTAREVLDEVGKDAFRFFLLSRAPETHMDFDLELALKESNENPVFYVQYAHARMAGILTRGPAGFVSRRPSSVDKLPAGELPRESLTPSPLANISLLVNDTEQELIKHLLEFPELVKRISRDYQVHHLTTYALGLADKFHKFYEENRVLNAETEELIKARLALVKASQIVLANSLKLLGVSAPATM